MTNKKSTKRALLSSVLSLVICLTMLIGTTFAWFTDSVTSTNNRIQSGTLQVDLLMDKEETGNEEDYKSIADGEGDIFSEATGNGILWEPGKTEIVYLAVANDGNLALKYNIVLDITDNGLAEALEYAIIDGAKATDLKAATKWADVEAYADAQIGDMPTGRQIAAPNGKLEEDGIDYFALAVHMKEEAGNEYQDKSIVIDLAVQATQNTVEEDSFDKYYDKDALYADETYTVNEEKSLADVLGEINNSDDEVVMIHLGENATWETGAEHGSTPWVTEGAAVKTLVIDGQGKTLTATGAGVGPIRMANGGTLKIKNATIVDQSVSYAEENWEFGYLEFDGNVEFENVEFVNAITMDGQNATFKNCKFNSNKDNEYAVWVSNGNAYFSNCTFSGPRGLKTHEAYGSEVAKIVVDNCTFDNLTKKPGVVIGTVNAATTIVIKNSDFVNCQAGDQSKYIYETDTDVTTFDFDCSQNNEVIKSVTPDLTISTAQELFAFANDVNVNGNSYAGKLIVLAANIDLNNVEWTPIGQTGENGVATYFQGMFDGKGHTISNLKITDNAYDEGANYAAGLFGFIDAADAQIVNLNVDGADVSGHHWTGVIAGYLSGKISGCTVTNATVKCTHANNDACGDKAGVITGYVNSGVVTGNTVKDCTVVAGRDAGQVVGAAKTTQAYDNNIYDVTVSPNGDCTGANIRNEEIGRVM